MKCIMKVAAQIKAPKPPTKGEQLRIEKPNIKKPKLHSSMTNVTNPSHQVNRSPEAAKEQADQ